ncbi:lipopolysaccharide biosynthesis protein [Bifidobacterium hapali]|uniref:Lipopolysaccharide biosynthesis protein n=1 Tax=Bifidobacterium hapali TaxID=1630172 RepID=A0A261G311_9BIFI|nr:lipopolysaccharide biosynthesis protein [Bifidobacterium hapali]OZG65396.1 lipopolysaccharide biosynthesis protein [Bifidobacterium hapali]
MNMRKKTKNISFFKAAFIQFASRYVNVFVQLVLTAILARLLSPEEYGIMAGLTVFTSLFAILADMGFGAGIIQYKQLDKHDFGGLFIFSLILATILSVAFLAAGIPIAWFYREPEYAPLCALAAVSVFFNTVNMVPNGILLRNKRFDVIGIRLVATTIIGGVIAVIMAVNGFGTYSLIWNVNITAIAIFLWNIASIRGQISFKQMDMFKPVRLIARYSAYQAGFSIINYFSRNTDHLIIGRFFGSAPLGLYDKAYKLTTYPIQFIPGVLGSVLQPYLSAYQDDKEKLHHYQMLMVKALAITGSWIAGVFILCGREIVLIFYGDQWLACVPLFTILSVSIIFQMVMNVTGGILQSAGRTDLLFRQGLAATTIMLLMLACGSLTGDVTLLTIFVTIAFIGQTFTVAYYTTYKAFDHPISEFLKPVATTLAFTCIPLAPLYTAQTFLNWKTNTIIIDLLIYATIYTTAFAIIFRRQFTLLISFIKQRKK